MIEKNKRARRGWSEGSIRKRGYRWIASVSRTYDGKRVRYQANCDTLGDARDALAELNAKHPRNEGRVATVGTLGELIELWLTESARHRVRETTLLHYQQTIRTHILSRIGHLSLAKVTPAVLRNMYAAMERDGVPPSTRQAVHLRLHTALRFAVRQEMLKANPAGAVDPPRLRSKPVEVWTVAETRRFLDAARSDRLYALYLLAIYTGLRQGELFALKWSAVDLDSGYLRVVGTLKRIQKRTFIDPPKSAAGRRLIRLPAEAVTALRELRERRTEALAAQRDAVAAVLELRERQMRAAASARELDKTKYNLRKRQREGAYRAVAVLRRRRDRQAEAVAAQRKERNPAIAVLAAMPDIQNRPYAEVIALPERWKHLGESAEDDFVFTDTRTSGPLRRSNVVLRSFEPILKRAGLRRIKFHGLRHAHASLLLAAGVHPKVVQERLGHADISMTLNTYSHLLQGMDSTAVAALDGLNLTGVRPRRPKRSYRIVALHRHMKEEAKV